MTSGGADAAAAGLMGGGGAVTVAAGVVMRGGAGTAAAGLMRGGGAATAAGAVMSGDADAAVAGLMSGGGVVTVAAGVVTSGGAETAAAGLTRCGSAVTATAGAEMVTRLSSCGRGTGAAGVQSWLGGGRGTVTAAAAVCNLRIATRVSMTAIWRVAWSHALSPASVVVTWVRLASGKCEVGVGTWHGA